MAERYRADHVGSLLRPAAVLEARAAHAAGRIGMAQLRDIEGKAILGVLEMQRQVGIDVFTDGEYRRSWWSGAIAESVEGIIDDPDAVFTPGWRGPSGAQADATAAEIGFGEQVSVDVGRAAAEAGTRGGDGAQGVGLSRCVLIFPALRRLCSPITAGRRVRTH